MLERFPFFRFYSADYLLDTLGLTSTEQHGAYLLLIINYMWEHSLPPDKPALYAMCRAVDQRNQDAVDLVLKRYFHDDDGRISHHRCERELEKLGEFISQQSAKGKQSAKVRAAKRVLAPKPPAKARANGQHASAPDRGFAAFYAAYPVHKGRAEAEKAWAKLSPDDALQGLILAAIAIQRQSSDWQREGGKYIPHPGTYLNGRRWQDETKPARSGGVWIDDDGRERNPDGSYRPAI